MGTLVDRDGGVEKDSASDPVVYQLVRVQGDGRLVPATDDDVIEVEQFFKDDKNDELLEDDNHQFSLIHDYDEGCLTGQDFYSKDSLLEELPQNESSEGGRKLNAKIEVKQETRIQLVGDHYTPPKSSAGDAHAYDNLKDSTACTDKPQGCATSKEISLGSATVTHTQCAQIESTKTCLEQLNDSATGISCASETCMNSIPDFSLLEGEVCLDKLPIRELQEVFKATFGRQTSVKDKLWLKRRIAMGLTNSCDVPTTNFIIKDNKIIQQESKEAPCRSLMSMTENIMMSMNQIGDHSNSSSRNSLIKLTNETADQQLSSKLRKSPSEYVTSDESLHIEQCATKRLRKPTKRYIEELSEFETRESTAKLHSSVKSSPKSQMTLICDAQDHGRNLSTRCDSVGGFGVQVPYVSRIRRSRPRKDFIALMTFVPKEKQKSADNQELDFQRELDMGHNRSDATGDITDHSTDFQHASKTFVPKEKQKSADNQELDFQRELDMGHNRSDATGDITDHSTDFQHASKVGVRRKHHRAWTICEVLKLVEGVARYGAGRWSEIRRFAFASYSYRTSVDLKDKWRNLLRASLAQDHNENGERNLRKHVSMPIPSPILSRVRELAALHGQSGSEKKPAKFATHGGDNVEEKIFGFL